MLRQTASILVSLSGQMYVEKDIVTNILVSLTRQMYVETDMVTSILVSLSGQMYVETDSYYPSESVRTNVC